MTEKEEHLLKLYAQQRIAELQELPRAIQFVKAAESSDRTLNAEEQKMVDGATAIVESISAEANLEDLEQKRIAQITEQKQRLQQEEALLGVKEETEKQ